MNDNIALNKLILLMRAKERMEWEDDLLNGAKEILQDHPDITMDEWLDKVKSLYPLEVVDTFGVDEAEIDRQLRNLWNDISVSKT